VRDRDVLVQRERERAQLHDRGLRERLMLPDPTQVTGPVGAHLFIPTPTDGEDGQATHPAVVYTGTAFSDYPYWMAMTPYTGSNDAEEDPCILASNDGVSWTVPSGLVNPI
ncbi:hypothetical protein ADL26_19245, partial [Thermoactinomyces vulgaris]